MLSRKCAIALVFVFSATGLFATDVPKDAYNDNPKYNFPNKWDATDTTDIFAIPVDESGDAQEEELDTLEEGYPPKK